MQKPRFVYIVFQCGLDVKQKLVPPVSCFPSNCVCDNQKDSIDMHSSYNRGVDSFEISGSLTSLLLKNEILF